MVNVANRNIVHVHTKNLLSQIKQLGEMVVVPTWHAVTTMRLTLANCLFLDSQFLYLSLLRQLIFSVYAI